MHAIAILWCIVTILQNFSVNSKTYYFNVNKTTNEFLIYNRVDLNRSIQNYPTNVYLSELRNVTVSNRQNGSRKYRPVLDPEWNYENENITKDELPRYIHKLYESTSKGINESISYGPIRVLFNSLPQNSSFIKFNLSSLDRKENLSSVELYFHLTIDDSLKEKPLVLRLYQIVENINETTSVNPDSHKILNVIYIWEAEDGWQVFKMRNGIENWLRGDENLGLLLTISKPNDSEFTTYRDTNTGELRSFAVVKTMDAEQINPQPQKESILQPSSCRKHDLYIDFKSLDWTNFIIAPEGYTAFTCFGKCYKNDNSLPSHAKLQLSVDSGSFKPLCCVPTNYIPLPIMFYDKNGNVIIKVYKDMVVEQCGCR